MFTKEKIFNFPVLLFIVLSGINLLLLNLPLTNVLHYEFSAVNAILQSLFGGLLAVYFVKINYSNKEIRFNIFSNNYKFLLVFTFSQFIIAFISSVLFKICPLSEGLLFYFVITLPAYFIGVVIGLFSFALSRKLTYIIFLVVWIIILTAPVIELYLNPQIYFYNPIIGFFPGTIYDEDISVTGNLIIYRILNLFFFSGLLVSITNKKIYKAKFSRTIVSLLFVIIVLTFTFLKSTFGFSTDIERMQNELKGKIETEHFVIIYPNDLRKNQIENLILSHEFAFTELKKELNDQPKTKIISFVFNDGAQKGEFFGANNADVAKPWLYQIYINYANFNASLQHELAHVFSANYGTTIFKIAHDFNPALIEGFATAFANNFDDNDIHYMAKLASESAYKISLKSLFDGFNFFGQTSSISYIYAGSFLNYLSGVYGADKVKTLYGKLDFKKIFNKNLDQLENEYFEFLNKKKFEINNSTASLYFGSKPIFKRFCARYAANQIKKGYNFYQKERYFEAEQIFSDIYEVSDSYQALVGKVNSLTKLNKEKESLNFLKQEIKYFDSTSYLFNLEVVLGSLFIHNNENKKADSVYTLLLEQEPSEIYKCLAVHRKLLLNESDTLALKYLKGSVEEKLIITEELLDKYKNPEIIPIYIDLAEKVNYKKKKDYLNTFWEQNNFSFSLFEISKLASENNDFEFAVECINKVLIFELSENKKMIYKDYLKKYNWFFNNKNDVLANTRIN